MKHNTTNGIITVERIMSSKQTNRVVRENETWTARRTEENNTRIRSFFFRLVGGFHDIVTTILSQTTALVILRSTTTSFAYRTYNWRLRRPWRFFPWGIRPSCLVTVEVPRNFPREEWFPPLPNPSTFCFVCECVCECHVFGFTLLFGGNNSMI